MQSNVVCAFHLLRWLTAVYSELSLFLRSKILLSLMNDIHMFVRNDETLKRLFKRKGKTLIENPDFVLYRLLSFVLHALCSLS